MGEIRDALKRGADIGPVLVCGGGGVGGEW